MSDVGRLLGWFGSGALMRPDSETPNTVDLARALAHLAGAADTGLTPGARRIIEAIGAWPHYVFVLVDGLGMNLLDRMAEGSFARRHLAMELRAVFPTSTAPALTSLATGLWPAEHAVPGWFTYLPDYDVVATILPFVDRAGQPLTGVQPREAFPAPVLAGQLTRAAYRVLPAAIASSVYSRYSGGGAADFGYDSLTAAVDAIERQIGSADGATYTYFYIPYVDAAQHTNGVYAPAVRDTLGQVLDRLETLAQRLAGRARIIASADHGLIDVPADARHILHADDELVRMLRCPPSCEPRTTVFHVRGGQHKAFARAFRARYGERFALLTLDEADELHLFGPVPLSAETRRRLGDFVAIPEGPDVILYEPRPELREMKGFHGGLKPDEVRVPLIVV